jgi:8-oxo-dGTP diphosphatase
MINTKGYQIPDAYVADVVVFTEDAKIVLIKRGKDPFQGKYALPGGHVEPREKGIQAAARELQEETGINIDLCDLFLVNVYDDLERDPRGWYIDAAFVTVIPDEKLAELKAGDDASEVKVFTVEEVLTGGVELAFDHREIILDATTLVEMEFEEEE